jgi:hypothetical protein
MFDFFGHAYIFKTLFYLNILRRFIVLDVNPYYRGALVCTIVTVNYYITPREVLHLLGVLS